MKRDVQNQKYFCEYLNTMLKERSVSPKASMLFIQNVNGMSTLPFHSQIYHEWAGNDVNYMRFINTLKNECFTVRFNIENLKCLIDSKSSWYCKLKNRAIYPLNQNGFISSDSLEDFGLLNGIRELNEGVFKYQPDQKALELNDRVLFIGASSIKTNIRFKKETFFNCSVLNEEINELRKQISPGLELKNRSLNSFMSKPIPKPKRIFD